MPSISEARLLDEPKRTSQEVIAALNLVPHPEKGFFIETFRDPDVSESRSRSTCIYYLLEGESGLSHWHRVRDAVEVWHHYAGAPLRLSLSWNDGSPVRDVVLGKDIWNGERPQVIVEKGEWQHAKSLGDWTLVGCSVAPAFVMESFEMAGQGWFERGFFGTVMASRNNPNSDLPKSYKPSVSQVWRATELPFADVVWPHAASPDTPVCRYSHITNNCVNTKIITDRTKIRFVSLNPSSPVNDDHKCR